VTAIQGRSSEPEPLAELAVQAVTVAAADLGVGPRAFAEELAQGEVALLVRYLAEAREHLHEIELCARIDALLHRLTAWTGDTG
jgi:hypothetical protein